MLDYEILNFIREIKDNTGIDIRIRTNKRENFYSRILFFTIVKKANPRITLSKMGGFVGLHHTTVIYSLKTYEIVKNYPDFKKIEREIRAIKLYKSNNSKIFCNPTYYPYVQN